MVCSDITGIRGRGWVFKQNGDLVISVFYRWGKDRGIFIGIDPIAAAFDFSPRLAKEKRKGGSRVGRMGIILIGNRK